MLNTNFAPWPNFTNEESEKIKQVLLSNKVNYWTGQECREFEREFAQYCGTKYAVALSNGTVALEAAFIALGIGKDDEVIVTSRTFLASASSIIRVGAIPVFVDICENSQNITSTNISKNITKKTKAILCVHLAGFPCEMDKIKAIAKREKIYIVEDCAQAHGARYRGKPVGSIGDIGCWSFCQDKIITTAGEGGMITTNNKQIWKKIWEFKDHGKSLEELEKPNKIEGFRYLHNTFGTNLRMTEIQAAIGRMQLKKLNKWNQIRNKYQNTIWSSCSNIPSLRVPKFNQKNWKYHHEGNVHGAYKCYIFLDFKYIKKNWNQTKIIKKINREGVPCYSGSCSEVYLEKAFKSTKFIPKKRLPIAKKLGETSLMFLIHPTLRMHEILDTCKAIKKVMKEVSIS